MATTNTIRKRQDTSTRLVYRALREHFPDLSRNIEDTVYRYNPASIRVRVIDPRFEGKSFREREQLISGVLSSLPEAVESDITLLLLLTADETRDQTDLMNLEFDDPSRTRL